jgi:hypothetical protein
MAGIQGQEFGGRLATGRQGGIMKMLTRAQLFVPPKMARKTKTRLERAKLVIFAARDRAIETAQQRAGPSMKRPPTVLQPKVPAAADSCKNIRLSADAANP